MRSTAVLCLLSACTCAVAQSSAAAQTPDTVPTQQRLQQVAQSYTGDQSFMGTALVARGDTTLLNAGYGLASVELNVPNAPDIRFRLGSLTKQFTATLVLLLQQDGKLDITRPIGTYLKDAPKTWEKITVANLLGHTSGIPNFTDRKEFQDWAMTPHDWPKEYAAYLDKPLDFEPGTKFAYSNSNYEVLGVLIEKLSGQKYDDVLRTRILDPLGMKSTGLDRDGLVLPHRAEGYEFGRKAGLRTVRTESMSVPWAAGSMYSTTGDLLLWEQALFGGRVLNPASLKTMTTPGLGGYGLGVIIHGTGDSRVVTHGGGIEGFNTYLSYVPAQGIAVVVLGNVNGDKPDRMGGQLLDVAMGKAVVLDTERKAVPISEAELAKFVGVYRIVPTFALTVSVQAGGLTVQATGQQGIPVEYQGVKDGHPTFFSALVSGSIEFIPDATGAYTSLILHQAGRDTPAKRE